MQKHWDTPEIGGARPKKKAKTKAAPKPKYEDTPAKRLEFWANYCWAWTGIANEWTSKLKDTPFAAEIVKLMKKSKQTLTDYFTELRGLELDNQEAITTCINNIITVVGLVDEYVTTGENMLRIKKKKRPAAPKPWIHSSVYGAEESNMPAAATSQQESNMPTIAA